MGIEAIGDGCPELDEISGQPSGSRRTGFAGRSAAAPLGANYLDVLKRRPWHGEIEGVVVEL